MYIINYTRSRGQLVCMVCAACIVEIVVGINNFAGSSSRQQKAAAVGASYSYERSEYFYLLLLLLKITSTSL